MRADPLALGALTICVIAWLLAAAALTLSLVGRLPGSRARSVSAVRLQLTAMLTLTTTAVLCQVGELARWASPVREALSLLTVITAIGAMPAMIKAATIQSRAKRPQAGHEPESPS